MSFPLKTQNDVREFLSRNRRALEMRPGAGQGTVKTKAELCEGLRCEVIEGPFRMVVDSGQKKGVEPSAVNPGVLGRASLASCITIAYAMWAALLDVPVDGIEVDLETDYDARGVYGVDDNVSPDYKEARYTVTMRTTAPRDDIDRVVEEAERHCTFLHVWQQPQKTVREIRVERPGVA